MTHILLLLNGVNSFSLGVTSTAISIQNGILRTSTRTMYNNNWRRQRRTFAAFSTTTTATTSTKEATRITYIEEGTTAAITAANPKIDTINIHQPYFPIFYNDVYEVPLPPRHRFPMDKYRKVRVKIQEYLASLSVQDGHVQCELHVSPLATITDLTTTHSPQYVNRYMSGNQTQDEIRNVGFPWSLQGVNRSLSSVGGTVAAASSICSVRWMQQMQQEQEGDEEKEEGLTSSSSSSLPSDGMVSSLSSYVPLWSAHVAGGTHHAFRDRGEGFCVFSDIAVAANVILNQYPEMIKRILIIDLDVHQGNGNAVLFQDQDNVFTFSMHCSSNYFSEKQQSDLDIELPPDCNDATYLGTLYYWLKRIEKEYDFDFVFYQAGVDGLEQDRLGRMALTHDGLERRNAMVFDFVYRNQYPLCITMGGGYPKNKDWEPILDAHANVYTQAFRYLDEKSSK